MNLIARVGLFLAYFAAGLVTDYLVARYYLFLSSRQRVQASALAVAIDFFGFMVTMLLVLNRDIPSAVAFALGTGVGTYVALGRGKK